MTTPAPYQPGDRVALVATDDPHTRLRPGDQGTVIRWDPAQQQLAVAWDDGSSLAVLLRDGDEVRSLDSPGPRAGEPAQRQGPQPHRDHPPR